MQQQRALVPDAPTLSRWFALVDGGDVDGVLGLLSDDFRMSMQLARGDGTALETIGTAADLADHLARRGRDDIRHLVLSAATVSLTEHVLGQTVQEDGVFVSSFSATARLAGSGGLVRQLLVCRTAALCFNED